MLTVQEVAQRLWITVRQVRALIRAERLRALNLSRNELVPRYRIDEADLQRFIEAAGKRPDARKDATTPARPLRGGKREIDPDAMALLEQVRQRRRRRADRN